MALMKWSPPKEIERWFEDFFEEPFLPRMWRKFPRLRRLRELEEISPSVDMFDKKDEIVVKAEIPGVEKENISISLSNNTIDRKSTRLNSSHIQKSRMPSSA